MSALAVLTLQPREVEDAFATDDSADHLWLTVEQDGVEYRVDIHFLVADAETDLGAARAHAIERFAAAGIPATVAGTDSPGTVTAQFAHNDYWWPERTTSWAYNSSGKPAGLTGDAEAIAAAAAAWAGAGADFAFEHEGVTTASTGACGDGIDGQNTIGWAPIPGNVLAITCTWYAGGANPASAVEFDMEIAPRWQWTNGTTVDMDLQSVATHEFGHAVGLGHASDAASIMFATYPAGATKHEPTPDDRAGIVAIYGASVGASVVADPGTKPSSYPHPGSAQPPPPPATLPLVAGASLVTWPYESADAAVAAAGGGGMVTAIYGYDADTRTWQRFMTSVPPDANSLQRLEPGEAYWFFTTNASAVRGG